MARRDSSRAFFIFPYQAQRAARKARVEDLVFIEALRAGYGPRPPATNLGRTRSLCGMGPSGACGPCDRLGLALHIPLLSHRASANFRSDFVTRVLLFQTRHQGKTTSRA